MNSDDLRTFFPQFHRILRDAQMRSALLPRLTEEEIEALNRLLEPVTTEVQGWCQEYAVINSSLIVPIAVWAIVQLPHFSARALSTVVRATLWAVAIDDLFDKQKVSSEELHELVREVYLLACQTSKTSKPKSIFGEILLALMAELKHYKLWSELHAFWATSLLKMLDGMVYEYWLQRQFKASDSYKALPNLDAYLHYATYSTTVPPMWISMLILNDDLSILKELPLLARLIEQCATAIRLANDLGGSRREEAESRINALDLARWQLLGQDRPLSSKEAIVQAKATVEKRLKIEQEKVHMLAESFRTESQIERRFSRSVDFGIELYGAHDLREWYHHLQSMVKSYE